MTINNPIYGKIQITEPVFLELIKSPAVQRLKKIDQNFSARIMPVPWGNYTRFDHSIGVMHLIKIMGGDLEEQIAGLLHDVSHTAFSHTMDLVFGTEEKADFHERHHERIVMKSDLPKILERYGFDITRIIEPKNFSILEQEIPALCADRIDYSLRAFVRRGLCLLATAQEFLNHLTTINGKIVFTDSETAQLFASLFLESDQKLWDGDPISMTGQHLFSKIIKEAMRKGVIAIDDFFLTDEEFLEKLDPESKQRLKNLREIKFKTVSSNEDYDFHVIGKIRYVDPLVLQTNDKVKRLSEINPKFKAELATALEKRKQGNYVKIIT